MKEPNDSTNTKATVSIWTLPKVDNYVIMMHMGIWNNRKPKKQNKFKQRKPKPSISFQIQQSVKFLLPVIKKADKQLKMKHSHRTPLFTLFVLWRCVIHVSITDSIFLILPSLPSTCPPQHAVNHCDVLSTQNNSEFPIWSQKEGCSFSVSYKVSKCIRPFPHFYDTTSAEKMLI